MISFPLSARGVLHHNDNPPPSEADERLKKAKRGKHRRNAEQLIEAYLIRRTIRSPETAVTTTNIANATKLSNDRTWRTLDKMNKKDKVDRTPDKEAQGHFLLNSITLRRYYGRKKMQEAFDECVKELLKYAMANSQIPTILNCTLDDIAKLTDVWRDLAKYNYYVATLTNKGLVTTLPQLFWRSDPIRWWLVK